MARFKHDEFLIELVRKHSVLYDLSNPKYIDSKLKEDIWNNIGQELNIDGSTCRSRWNNIRDQYRKNLKKTLTKSGQSSKRIKPYKYNDQLFFLKHFFQERETKSNIESQEGAIEDEIASCNSISDDSNTPISSPTQFPFPDPAPTLSSSPAVYLSSSPAPSPPVSFATPPSLYSTPSPDIAPTLSSTIVTSPPPDSIPIKSKNKTLNPPKSAAASLMEYVLKKNEASQPLHPIDAFLAGIGTTLKNLSPYHQNLAKSELFAVVQKYEMQMLKENQEVSNIMAANTSTPIITNAYASSLPPTSVTANASPRNEYSTLSVDTVNNDEHSSPSLFTLRGYIGNFPEN